MKESLTENIENDDFFREFLRADTSTVSNNPISSSNLSIAEQIAKLTEGLEIISNELQSQVREQHGALLSQASHASKLNVALDSVSGHMECLKASAERLKTQVYIPYSMLENQTRVLERLHDTSHLLRQSGRFLQLYRQLLQFAKDPVAQARTMYELEPLIEDNSLSQIELIQDERAKVLSIRQKLNNVAHKDLTNGLKSENETQVINSLQIFSNLHTLSKYIDNFLETCNNDIKQSIKDCYAGADVSGFNAKKLSKDKAISRGPGKASGTFSTTQNFRSKLWTALEWLFDDEICGFCQQIVFLQKCLQNIQNSTWSGIENNDIERRFHNNLETLLKVSFADCAPHIAQALQQDLPKLLASARGLQAKFGIKFIFSNAVFEPLEPGYLEKCGTNLKSSLSTTDCPTQATVDNFIRAASSELSAAMVDHRLCLLVAGAFNACNSDFLTKVESHIKFGTDSQQVVDIPNASQLQNISLANVVYYHNEQVRRLIQNLGTTFSQTEAAEKILNDLTKGETLVLTIIEQLITALISAVNIILLSIHREPGLNNDKLSLTGQSFYMKELQEFIQRAWNLHIAPFSDKQTIEKCGKELASRCIELFVRNVAIIRPISMAGRTRLKSDCQHLELALKPIISDVSSLGKPYRMLRAIYALITLPPEELSKQSIDLAGPVPSYIILFLLFGYGGNELTSPHTAAEWSNEKLIQWLDGHTSDKERLELISGALQKYRTIVRQRNIAQYDSVYPYISSYLEKAYKMLN